MKKMLSLNNDAATNTSADADANITLLKFIFGKFGDGIRVPNLGFSKNS